MKEEINKIQKEINNLRAELATMHNMGWSDLDRLIEIQGQIVKLTVRVILLQNQ